MNMVEFKITDPARESEGIVELSRRMRVTCLEGTRFLVAESGLAVLDRLGISYNVLSVEPFNYERHAVPHLAAAQVP
jgi:hypothetical protein